MAAEFSRYATDKKHSANWIKIIHFVNDTKRKSVRDAFFSRIQYK